MAGRGGYRGGSTIIQASYGYVKDGASNKRGAHKKASNANKNLPFHKLYFSEYRADQINFSVKGVKNKDFIGRFSYMIRNLRDDGRLNSRNLALQLNRLNIMTASGERWTTEICSTLIKLHDSFFPRRRNRPATSPARTRNKRSGQESTTKLSATSDRNVKRNEYKTTIANENRENFSKIELAERSSALGRVIPRKARTIPDQ